MEKCQLQYANLFFLKQVIELSWSEKHLQIVKYVPLKYWYATTVCIESAAIA